MARRCEKNSTSVPGLEQMNWKSSSRTTLARRNRVRRSDVSFFFTPSTKASSEFLRAHVEHAALALAPVLRAASMPCRRCVLPTPCGPTIVTTWAETLAPSARRRARPKATRLEFADQEVLERLDFLRALRRRRHRRRHRRALPRRYRLPRQAAAVRRPAGQARRAAPAPALQARSRSRALMRTVRPRRSAWLHACCDVAAELRGSRGRAPFRPERRSALHRSLRRRVRDGAIHASNFTSPRRRRSTSRTSAQMAGAPASRRGIRRAAATQALAEVRAAEEESVCRGRPPELAGAKRVVLCLLIIEPLIIPSSFCDDPRPRYATKSSRRL